MNPFTPDYQFAITKTHNHAITETLSFMLNFFFIQIIFYLTSRKTFSLMKINSTSWATGVGSSSNCVKNVKQHNACICFDNLHPNISMYILQTVFHTFPKVLTRRILFNNQGLLSCSHNDESDIHISYCDSVSLMFLQCELLNPLTSKISLAILLTVCHRIHLMLVWRIWNWINQ